MSTTPPPSPSLNHSFVVNSNMFEDKAGNGNLHQIGLSGRTIEPVYVIMVSLQLTTIARNMVLLSACLAIMATNCNACHGIGEL